MPAKLRGGELECRNDEVGRLQAGATWETKAALAGAFVFERAVEKEAEPAPNNHQQLQYGPTVASRINDCQKQRPQTVVILVESDCACLPMPAVRQVVDLVGALEFASVEWHSWPIDSLIGPFWTRARGLT